MKRNISVLFFTVFLFTSAQIVHAGTIQGKISVKGIRSPENTVVYIDKMAGTFPPPKEHAIVDQRNMSFIPHVLPIVAGTTVDFKNNDDVLHNVFTPDECAEKFNLGTWAKGGTRSFIYKNAGCRGVLLCNVHPEMEGWVVVLQNPHFCKTGKDGLYTIKNVPAGTYTLKAWLPKATGPDSKVTVPQNGSVTVDISMTRKR